MTACATTNNLASFTDNAILVLGNGRNRHQKSKSKGKMNEISVGAVGAAIIAGLVSFLGLIIGKEQKVSEFRQSWIDDLRKCFVLYLVTINAISDALRLNKSSKGISDLSLLEYYKSLNEASHGIYLRVNADEKYAQDLIGSMNEFETIAKSNSTLTPDRIRAVEERFLESARRLLKYEWNCVKEGEKIFVRTKIIVLASIALMTIILLYDYLDIGNNLVLWLDQPPKTRSPFAPSRPTGTGA